MGAELSLSLSETYALKYWWCSPPRTGGIQIRRGQGRNDDGQFYVRYCFADPIHADAFCDQFGGEWLNAKPR